MTEFINAECRNLICGERLGGGQHREVFRHAFDLNLVVKIEAGTRGFSNIIEWETYHAADAKLQVWLCPCIAISPSGAVLIQRYASPIRANELPKRAPACLTDFKISNWGMLGDKPVCIDYGMLARPDGRLLRAPWG